MRCVDTDPEGFLLPLALSGFAIRAAFALDRLLHESSSSLGWDALAGKELSPLLAGTLSNETAGLLPTEAATDDLIFMASAVERAAALLLLLVLIVIAAVEGVGMFADALWVALLGSATAVEEGAIVATSPFWVVSLCTDG